MFAQYNITDTSPVQIQATTMNAVDDAALSAAGRAQVEIPDGTDISTAKIDTTQTPPVLV